MTKNVSNRLNITKGHGELDHGAMFKCALMPTQHRPEKDVLSSKDYGTKLPVIAAKSRLVRQLIHSLNIVGYKCPSVLVPFSQRFILMSIEPDSTSQ